VSVVPEARQASTVPEARQASTPATGVEATVGQLAATAIGLLVARDQTVGTAESLTGGLVAAALTAVPGASVVFRGGIVAYSAGVKQAMLGVPADLIARVGTVDAEVARAMAVGARLRLQAAVGVATTGVAGPDLVDGHPVGTVHLAVSTSQQAVHRKLNLTGDREQIRRATVLHALSLLVSELAKSGKPDG
jgi:nicotinamide-nucleotide amidase